MEFRPQSLGSSLGAYGDPRLGLPGNSLMGLDLARSSEGTSVGAMVEPLISLDSFMWPDSSEGCLSLRFVLQKRK